MQTLTGLIFSSSFQICRLILICSVSKSVRFPGRPPGGFNFARGLIRPPASPFKKLPRLKIPLPEFIYRRFSTVDFFRRRKKTYLFPTLGTCLANLTSFSPAMSTAQSCKVPPLSPLTPPASTHDDSGLLQKTITGDILIRGL